MAKQVTIVLNHKPTDHICDEESSVLLLADGSRIPYTKENYEKYVNDIIGGSVCCSICGRAAIDEAYFL